MFVYLRRDVCVEIPDSTEVSVVDDEFHCFDSAGRLLAKFAAADVQLYSRIKLRASADDAPDESDCTGASH